MGKSLQGMHDVLEKRRQELWQIGLMVVLYRYQQQFHMEQPDGSHMLLIPKLVEIKREMLVCQFDLCNVGKLVDPEASMPIRKRLNVMTTRHS